MISNQNSAKLQGHTAFSQLVSFGDVLSLRVHVIHGIILQQSFQHVQVDAQDCDTKC